MGAVCPSRKQSSSKAQETYKPVKINYTVDKPSAAKEVLPKVVSTTPTQLPTKSWRALLEDASLNAEAKPFIPADPPGLPKPGTNQNQDSGEGSKFKRGVRTQTVPVPGYTQGSTEGLVPMTDGLGGGGMTIQTQTYMQLLKEGSMKKKPPTGLRNKETRQSGKEKVALTSGGKTVPMTVSGLKQTWHNALKVPARSDDVYEETASKVLHDDLEIEKMNADQDLSDPVYWSETECAERKDLSSNASAHRLGRRQAGATIRSYVMQDLSFQLDRAVGMMLLRLHRFGEQQRAFSQDNGSVRRLVIGLKEVARRVKQAKVSCLVVAPDLESDTTEGGLDDRVREVLAMCYEKKIPIIFALSRTRLGHALGKSMTVSLLGVLDITGAKDLYDDAIKLADKARQTWLARIPTKQ